MGLTVTTVESEEELLNLISDGRDTVVKLSFPYCRPCKKFWSKYQKFAAIYSETRFVRIVGNLNDSCQHYHKEVLKAKKSPMFAVYCGGSLVGTWTGINDEHFVKNLEELLPTARGLTNGHGERQGLPVLQFLEARLHTGLSAFGTFVRGLTPECADAMAADEDLRP